MGKKFIKKLLVLMAAMCMVIGMALTRAGSRRR